MFSGMAASRASEIGSTHPMRVPHSPAFSRSSAAERRFTRFSTNSRVMKPISRLSPAWILIEPRRLRLSLYQGGYGAHDGVVGTHGLARWMDVAMTRWLGRRMKPITVT